MDITKILAELKSEREQIEEAIVSLERLARGRGRRRGRPPSWMADVTAPKRLGRPPGNKNKAMSVSAGNGGPVVTRSEQHLSVGQATPSLSSGGDVRGFSSAVKRSQIARKADESVLNPEIFRTIEVLLRALL